MDQIPCPECGRVQPRMVGHQKNTAHLGLTAAVFGTGAAAVLVGANDVISRDASAFVLAALAAGAALIHLAIARSDPNRDQEANRDSAARAVESGAVEVIRAGDPDNGEPPPRSPAPATWRTSRSPHSRRWRRWRRWCRSRCAT
ncbi:MAG: hypothetical protein J0I06_28665 [Planctomycetes bacterium]|nr:hypothetical protein [Planctomycetota bacterium]